MRVDESPLISAAFKATHTDESKRRRQHSRLLNDVIIIGVMSVTKRYPVRQLLIDFYSYQRGTDEEIIHKNSATNGEIIH